MKRHFAYSRRGFPCKADDDLVTTGTKLLVKMVLGLGLVLITADLDLCIRGACGDRKRCIADLFSQGDDAVCISACSAFSSDLGEQLICDDFFYHKEGAFAQISRDFRAFFAYGFKGIVFTGFAEEEAFLCAVGFADLGALRDLLGKCFVTISCDEELPCLGVLGTGKDLFCADALGEGEPCIHKKGGEKEKRGCEAARCGAHGLPFWSELSQTIAWVGAFFGLFETDRAGEWAFGAIFKDTTSKAVILGDQGDGELLLCGEEDAKTVFVALGFSAVDEKLHAGGLGAKENPAAFCFYGHGGTRRGRGRLWR